MIRVESLLQARNRVPENLVCSTIIDLPVGCEQGQDGHETPELGRYSAAAPQRVKPINWAICALMAAISSLSDDSNET